MSLNNYPKQVSTFAYVGCRTTRERNARGKGINVFCVDNESGNWEHIQLLENIINPSFLTFNHTRTFMYCVHGDSSEVSAFRVNKDTGRLEFINQQSTGGKNPVHLVVDPTDQFLIVANYISGTLSVLPINSDGSLEPFSDLIRSSGTLDFKVNEVDLYAKQGISHPHHIPFNKNGRFLVVPDLGLNKIYTFTLDTTKGRLIANQQPFGIAPKGSGPRHIDFHPTLPYAYAINELDSTIVTYHFDDQEGKLELLHIQSTLPHSIDGNTGAGIAVAPSGRFVYASNRGHDSIVTFRIDESTGKLTSVDWVSTQGKTPRFFTLDPTGEFLYVANEDSDTIITFKVNKETGKLIPTGQVINTESPVCIVFSSHLS